MSRSIRPPVATTSRTTARPRVHRRSEAGDTLVEILLALVVLGMASVALLIAFGTTISASADHRNLAEYNTILTTATQEAIADINSEPDVFVDACTTNITAYPDYSSGFPLPAPYTGKFFVTYVTTNPVEWWNGSAYNPGTWNASANSYPSPPCENNQPQLITIGFTAGGTTYTNSFVVQYPVTQKNSFSGNATKEQLVLLNYSTVGGGYAGSPMTTQPIYEIEDNDGIPVTTDLSPVVLTLNQVSGAGTLANCQGNEVLGVITFSGCSVSSGGTYTLSATDGKLTAINGLSSPYNLQMKSSTFTISSSTYSLEFTSSDGLAQQPIAGNSGSVFATDPTVEVATTATGTADAGWAGTVTFTFSGGSLSNSGGLTSGFCPSYTGYTSTATSVTEVVQPNGTAAVPSTCDFYGGYFFNAASSPQITATQYTITATANPTSSTNAAVPVLSSAFSVKSFGAPSQLVFSTEPTGVGNASASTPFTGQPAVKVEDAYGNQVTSATAATVPVTLAFSPGTPSGETLSGCSPTVANGVYTFSGCAGSVVDNGLTITASSTTSGIASATSTAFNITGPATQLLFTTAGQPVAQNSGSSFVTQPILVFEDAGNNVVTSVTTPITLAPSGGTLSTCTNLVPSLGYVNVANCAFAGLVGTNYTLTATAGSGSSQLTATSATFSPTGPGQATQLIFSVEPAAGPSTYVMSTQPVIVAEDSAGNVASTTPYTITLVVSGGTLANCTNLTSAAGVVNVANCSFGGVVGTNYTMTASSTSPVLTSPASTNFSPSGPGPLTQIALSGCPNAITTLISCTEKASLEDAYGNVETGDYSSQVTFGQVGGTGTASGFAAPTDSAGLAVDTLTARNAGTVIMDATADGLTSPTFTMTVNVAPTISTTSLATATQTQTGYAQTLTETGGTAPFTWSISSSTLPSGLTLNPSTGVISGTAGASATTTSFSVKVTDADGLYATQPLSITVNVAPAITAATPPAATQTQTGYSFTPVATGGTTPFTWSVSSGTLPSGLLINSGTGAITGTLGGSATTQIFTVQAVDANGVAATQTFTLTVNLAPTVSPSTLRGVTQGGAYSQLLTVSGGTSPFSTWSITSGTLPSGLNINTSTGLISGTVSGTATTTTFGVKITDANGVVATQTYTVIAYAAPAIAASPTPSAATQTQTGYSFSPVETGGTPSLTWSIASGTPLPSGLSINTSTGQITGTLGGSATTATGVGIRVTDANGVAVTRSFTFTVNAAPTITPTTLPGATLTGAYSQQLTVNNGTFATTPTGWSISSGALPSGLTISSSTGIISGTVTGTDATGPYSFTAQIIDNNGVAATQPYTLTVNAKPTITSTTTGTTTLPGATLTGAYSQSLTVSGGTGPYSATGWSKTSGSLPVGLSFNTNGTVTGTVTGSDAIGPYSFTAQITDANGVVATQSISLTVAAKPTITVATPPVATQTQTGYSFSPVESGGTPSLTWSIASGTPLPSGLSINTSTGQITGTLGGSATTATGVVIQVSDANGVVGTLTATFTVNAAPTITSTTTGTTTLPGATLTGAYSQSLTVSGGTGPYSATGWSKTSGSLPVGLSFNTNGTVTGTVTGSDAIGPYSFTAQITDANGVVATQSISLTVAAKPTITVATPPVATQTQTGYSFSPVESGGTPSLTWSIASGTPLPSGLSINTSTGQITGTLGGSATTATGVVIQVSDANGVVGTLTATFTVNAKPTITSTTTGTTTLPGATLTGAYSQSLTVSGGTGPYSATGWSKTSGSLPVGLSFNTNGTVTGTVTGSDAIGPYSFTAQITDANGVVATQSISLTVNPLPTISTSSLATATVGETNYAQTVSPTANTGTTPYGTWSQTSGTMPTGLSINTMSGVISGTVGGSAGTYNFTVQVLDANSVAATKSLSIMVYGTPSVTTSSPLQGATQGGAYAPTLAASGGTGTYTWAVTSGAPPTGLTLTSAGAFSGTVTASDATGPYTFMVTVTDSNGVSANKSLTLTVYAPPSITTNSPLPNGTHGSPYSTAIAAANGAPTLTFTLTGGSLGSLALSSSGVISGTQGSAGMLSFTVTVTDANGLVTSKPFTITFG